MHLKTLSQMEILSALSTSISRLMPEKGLVDALRFKGLVGVADRILSLFDEGDDTIGLQDQIRMQAAVESRVASECREVIVDALQGCGIHLAPIHLSRCEKALGVHLAYVLGRPVVRVSPDTGLDAWLAGGGTGMSSLFIACVLAPPEVFIEDREHYLKAKSHPSGCSDFGRCHRLLEVMPSWRDPSMI
jgi:hypothetical protein